MHLAPLTQHRSKDGISIASELRTLAFTVSIMSTAHWRIVGLGADIYITNRAVRGSCLLS